MLVFILVGLIVTLIIDIIIRIKHNIAVFGMYRPVNSAHKWFEYILTILFFISVLIAAFALTYKAIYVLFFGYLTILDSVRALMEYKKGIKEEKEYIIYFVWAVSFSVLFVVSMIFAF